MPRFNLVDEPWIPCAGREGGVPQLLSLRGVFAEAPQLKNIADPSPAVTISLYRLLLAVLHRSLEGPADVQEWRAVNEHGAWDLDRINAYLDRWHDRFDLFDDQHPFYQTPGLPLDEAPLATQLTQERASTRNRFLLFDHTSTDATLSPAEAARYLLTMHNYAVGGLISLVKGEPLANKTTVSAPLLGGAAVLVRGETLFKTLMRNWVQYDRDSDLPFAFRGNDDRPAWEREGGARPEARHPDGYVDLLTWQSRRILLAPVIAAEGATRVRAVALMKGFQFTESYEPWNAETMLAYRMSKNKTRPGWFAVGLNPDKVVWRDSQTLFQSVADERLRPKVMKWIDDLVEGGALDEQQRAQIEIYGLIPDQANILDWRRESLPIRLRLLEQGDTVTQHLLQHLGEAIALAESVGRLFDATLVSLGGEKPSTRSPFWVLCETLLVGAGTREPKREDCAVLARSFAPGPRYWSRLDAPFRDFLLHLADQDDVLEEEGALRYGVRALRAWVQVVRRVAREVFAEIADDLDTSARSLQARAKAEQLFRYQLAALTAPYAEPLPASQAEGVLA